MLLDLTPSASFNYPPHAAAFVRNKYLHILAHATHFSAKKRKEEKKVKRFHIWACDAGGTSRRWLNRGDRSIQHCPRARAACQGTGISINTWKSTFGWAYGSLGLAARVASPAAVCYGRTLLPTTTTATSRCSIRSLAQWLCARACAPAAVPKDTVTISSVLVSVTFMTDS